MPTSMLALRVKRENADPVLQFLKKNDLLDKDRRIQEKDGLVEIPVVRYLTDKEEGYLSDYGIETITQDRPIMRTRYVDPIDNILAEIELPDDLKPLLPRRWELLGDVLVLKIPDTLQEYEEEIARTYAKELKAKTVLKDASGISGEYREPDVELIWGRETETVHKENGVLFKFDPRKIMFSSGNIDERERMATIAEDGEVVVDMFAGIGYFSIPMAVHSKPKKITACEINPTAYHYLKENTELNRVGHIVEPLFGSNLETAPENTADRIIMGYIGTTHTYLEKALKVLKPEGGIIHYHETCPNELLPDRPLKRVESAASTRGKKAELLNFKNIKSYAPGVSHVVLDVKIY